MTAAGTTARYAVRLGGSPPDSAEWCGTLEEAWAAAERMAAEIAEREGTDPGTLGRYDHEGDRSVRRYRGVCPDGQSGDYWPIITEPEEDEAWREACLAEHEIVGDDDEEGSA